MKKYAALISYAGTAYHGWQKQKGSAAEAGPAIQGTFEDALRRLTGEDRFSCVGSGRTDSGVHAVGQVVHFVLEKKVWDVGVLRRGMNSLLPQDIQVIDLREVPLSFHAQRSAVRKQYSYYFQQGSCALPHLEPYSWWIRKELDRHAMQEGMKALIGEKEFKPFQASGSNPGPTVRTIFEASVEWLPIPFPGFSLFRASENSPFGLVRVRVVGSGFLKQMVRGIAGTLLQVGEGRRPSQCFEEILALQDRKLVGPTAPARALWLEKVWYPEVDWESPLTLGTPVV